MHDVKVTISDPAESRSLRQWLERLPDVRVEITPGEPAAGELGLVDLLTVLAGSSGALAVAVRTLPEYIKSRRSDLEIEMKVGDREFKLRASNAEEVSEIIGKLLDD